MSQPQVSTRTGVIVILGIIAIVSAITTPWRRAKPHTPPAELVIVDVGYLVTTGTQRCQEVVVENWCDEFNAHLPNITRTRVARSQVRTDDCDQQERHQKEEERRRRAREGKSYKPRMDLLGALCRKTYKDVMSDWCKSVRLEFVPLAPMQREAHGRTLGPAEFPPPPPPPPCGSPECGAGCTTPIPAAAAHVVFARKADDATMWRCPAELTEWNGAVAGAPFVARLSTCTRAP